VPIVQPELAFGVGDGPPELSALEPASLMLDPVSAGAVPLAPPVFVAPLAAVAPELGVAVPALAILPLAGVPVPADPVPEATVVPLVEPAVATAPVDAEPLDVPLAAPLVPPLAAPLLDPDDPPPAFPVMTP